MELNERYLQARETSTKIDNDAYFWLRKRFTALSDMAGAREKAALSRLKMRSSYAEIKKLVEWLDCHGNPRDRSRILFPLAWLAARQGRVELISFLKRKGEIQVAEKERLAALKSEEEAEKKRAGMIEAVRIGLFFKEYPTEAERRRAVIRAYNLNLEKFCGLTLEDDSALKLAIGLCVEAIEALSRFDQEGETPEQEGAAQGKESKTRPRAA